MHVDLLELPYFEGISIDDLVALVETSSAEMIQSWNPGARVVKAFATLGSYVVDNPAVVGGPVTVPIASDDREAKEQVARIIAAMGLDPVDASE